MIVRPLAVLAVSFLSGCVAVGERPEAFPGPVGDCARRPGFDYCVYSPPEGVQSDERSILYFLHGGNDNARFWEGWPFARAYYAYFKAQGYPAPIVVAVSFGDLWLLTEKSPGGEGGYLDKFVDEVMPYVERLFPGSPKRFLWGMSMGGFNTAQLLLKKPELWSAVVISCPAILPVSPFSPQRDVRRFIRRAKANSSQVEWVLKMQRTQFESRKDWERHDPLRLALRATGIPPVFIECGDRDEYGFFDGAKAFAERLQKAGNAVTFERIPGGVHCTLQADKIMPFLGKYTHPPH